MPASFDLHLSLPHDLRFAATIRDLAAHAAQFVGCGDARAMAFGREAEELLRACLEDNASRSEVPVIVRRHNGSLEVQIDERRITLDF